LIRGVIPRGRSPFRVVCPTTCVVIARRVPPLRWVVTPGDRSTGIHQEEPQREGERRDPNESPAASRTRLGQVHCFSLQGRVPRGLCSPGWWDPYPGMGTRQRELAQLASRKLRKTALPAGLEHIVRTRTGCLAAHSRYHGSARSARSRAAGPSNITGWPCVTSTRSKSSSSSGSSVGLKRSR
jgi:hypothetical protein